MSASAEHEKTATRYRFGLFEADSGSGELRKSGVRLRLQAKPFRVLLCLLERPGELVTREEFQQRLWGDDTIIDFDHSLGTAFNKLREALRDSADNPSFICVIASSFFAIKTRHNRHRQKGADVNRGAISIRGERYSRSRTIPIGPDLRARLPQYQHGLSKVPGEILFLVGKDGKALNEDVLRVALRKLRRLAGIQRYDGAIYQPGNRETRARAAPPPASANPTLLVPCITHNFG